MKKSQSVLRYRILFSVFLLLSSPVVPASGQEKGKKPEHSDLYAASAVLMDADSGRVLYDKNASDVLPMASTTKIMTCLYALEKADPGSIVTVSERAVKAPPVKLYLKQGEQFYLKDLLYSLMLESHNDTAVAISEAVGGSVEEFCRGMTEKAERLGCTHTCFETPNGLDSRNHHTTAYELALITREALKNKTFRKIIKTPSYEFTSLDGTHSVSLLNHNAFLSLYPGAIGVKTGYTGKAGYCFTGAVESEGRTFISVLLGCGWPPYKTRKWADTEKLMDYAIHQYHYRTILSPEQISLPVLPVKNGISDHCSLYIKDRVRLLISPEDRLSIRNHLPGHLTAPLCRDKKIGTLELCLNGEPFKTIPVYTKSSSKKPDLYYCLHSLFLIYCRCLPCEGL